VSVLAPEQIRHLGEWHCWHAVARIEGVGEVTWVVFAGDQGRAMEYARRAVAREWPLAESWTLRVIEP
jgi:hypothetical protein